jgi:hypothetical protein
MDQLIFNVRNASNTAAVIISDDPAVNAVTLVVTNAFVSDLRLRAGAPVMEPPPDGGPSSLYLSFGDLVAAAAIPEVKVDADGWQVKYFSDPAPAFALTPVRSRSFADKSSVNIRIFQLAHRRSAAHRQHRYRLLRAGDRRLVQYRLGRAPQHIGTHETLQRGGAVHRDGSVALIRPACLRD